MNLGGRASLTELIWTLGCAPGLYYNMRIALSAAIDLTAIRIRRINSLREYAASTSLTLFCYLALIQVMFVLVGGLAMIAPNHSNEPSPMSYVITAVFLLISLMSSAIAFIVNKRRRNLLEMIRAIEEETDVDKLREVIHGKH